MNYKTSLHDVLGDFLGLTYFGGFATYLALYLIYTITGVANFQTMAWGYILTGIPVGILVTALVSLIVGYAVEKTYPDKLGTNIGVVTLAAFVVSFVIFSH